jgi:1,4-alpha-glucan branching enzyme
VSGTFNEWGDPIPLRKKSDGTFELLVQLGEGRYEYKFVVDGEWKHDPTQMQGARVFISGVEGMERLCSSHTC